MKKLRRLILTVILALALVSCKEDNSMCQLETDISNDQKIEKLIDLGIIKGDQDGLRLDESIARSEITAIILRALEKEEEVDQWKDKVFFPDMLSYIDHWWSPGYVNLATRYGIIEGFQDGDFRPNAPMLQNEMVTIMLRTLDIEPIDTLEGMDWAVHYINKARELDLIGENFQQYEEAPREQVFTLLYDIMAMDNFKSFQLNELGFLGENLEPRFKLFSSRKTLGKDEIKSTIVGDDYQLSDNDDSTLQIVGTIGDYLYYVEDKYTLSRSLDIDQKTTRLFTFNNPIDGVFITDRDTIFVSASEDRWHKDAKGEIFRSENFGESYEKVLDLEHGTAIHTGFDSYMDTVFVAEYGIKDQGHNARNIYRSVDDGKNFELVYSPETEEGYHNHTIHIDRYNPDTVYQVIGDDNKRLLISKDGGESFETVWWGNYHPMDVIDYPGYLLYALDNVPYSGLAKLDKETLEIQEIPTPRYIKGPIYSMVRHKDKIYYGTISYEWIHDYGSGIYSVDADNNTETLLKIRESNKSLPNSISYIVQKGDYLYLSVKFYYRDDGVYIPYSGTMKLKLDS